MEFELAYDLEMEVDHEVVFVLSDDKHRKVRIQVTDVQHDGDTVNVTGNSLGSSVKDIKAAKKDEPPVVVRPQMTRVDGAWRGSVTNA